MYLTQVHAYAVQRRDKILPANLMQGITAPPADGSFVPVQGNSSFHATSAESHPMTQPMRPPRQACHPDFAFSDHFPINFLIFFRSFFRSFSDHFSDLFPIPISCHKAKPAFVYGCGSTFHTSVHWSWLASLSFLLWHETYVQHRQCAQAPWTPVSCILSRAVSHAMLHRLLLELHCKQQQLRVHCWVKQDHRWFCVTCLSSSSLCLMSASLQH